MHAVGRTGKRGVFCQKPFNSQPLLSFKVEEHQQGHNEHEAHGQGVAVGPVELGHVPATGLGIEIHAVDACDEGERDEDGGDDGEHLHDFVHAVAEGRHVHVVQAENRFAQVFDVVDDLGHVIVHVAQEDFDLGGDMGAFVAQQLGHTVAQRPNGFSEVEEVATQTMDFGQ